mmetsp:Transcript_37594/g.82735  ORF Transcript_37594/g.82735 Transcript_37594/m.82735 type:complete len:93 (+) Transcript_37594:561-839(+)
MAEANVIPSITEEVQYFSNGLQSVGSFKVSAIFLRTITVSFSNIFFSQLASADRTASFVRARKYKDSTVYSLFGASREADDDGPTRQLNVAQ